jgi:DNA-binding NtrC family response regulator
MNEQVLLIDDDKSFRFSVRDFLSNYDIEVIESETGKNGMEIIKGNSGIQCVLLDLNLPDADGIELISQILKVKPDIYIIIISAYTETEKAVNAIKSGAYDYIIKPIDLEVIKFELEKIFNTISIKKQLQYYKGDKEFVLIGDSKIMRDIREYIEKIADSDLPVLITGETGTGKEVVARTIHSYSKRKGTFVEVNCSSIPEDLFESELFGHSQYSFTDAKKERTGKVRIAENGTLFLDEIGEMPLNLQPKVLRFLGTKEY